MSLCDVCAKKETCPSKKPIEERYGPIYSCFWFFPNAKGVEIGHSPF